MTDSWAFRLTGEMNQAVLDRLRLSLGLSASGRLTDDWDELFGEGRRLVDDVVVTVELWRDVDSSEWRLDVDFAGDVADQARESMLGELRESVRSAGMSISSSFRRPGAE